MQFINPYKILLTIALTVLISVVCFAEHFLPNASYRICFSPGSNCSREVIKAIAAAKKQVLVQAYSFTDADIARALIETKNRGVEVKIILDKTQVNARHGQSRFLTKNGIRILIDRKPTIAHNKIIVIDDVTVLGGSYNYTASAAKRNAENLTIINDANFAKQYIKNWQMRERESITIDRLPPQKYSGIKSLRAE